MTREILIESSNTVDITVETSYGARDITISREEPIMISGTNQVVNETPAGIVNNINASYMTAMDFIPETVEVYMNGLKQNIIDDYQTIGSRTITMMHSPQIGDVIKVNYLKL